MKILVTIIILALVIILAPIIIGVTIRGQNAEWIGFWANVAGGILSGGMTLIAALVAWEMVRTQITSNEKLHRLPAEEAFEAICKELSEYCSWIDEVWKAFDYALNTSDPEEIADRVSIAVTAFGVGSEFRADIIEELLPALQPQKRLEARRIVSVMKAIEAQRGTLHSHTDQTHDVFMMTIVRDRFSEFDGILAQFAPKLGATFNNRTKIQRKDWTLADRLRDFLEQQLARER